MILGLGQSVTNKTPVSRSRASFSANERLGHQDTMRGLGQSETNERPVYTSHDHSKPMRGQYPGHVHHSRPMRG